MGYGYYRLPDDGRRAVIHPASRSKVSKWLADEASLIAEEIVWRGDWLGSYRAVRVIDGVKIEITVTATEATA